MANRIKKPDIDYTPTEFLSCWWAKEDATAPLAVVIERSPNWATPDVWHVQGTSLGNGVGWGEIGVDFFSDIASAYKHLIKIQTAKKQALYGQIDLLHKEASRLYADLEQLRMNYQAYLTFHKQPEPEPEPDEEE